MINKKSWLSFKYKIHHFLLAVRKMKIDIFFPCKNANVQLFLHFFLDAKILFSIFNVVHSIRVSLCIIQIWFNHLYTLWNSVACHFMPSQANLSLCITLILYSNIFSFILLAFLLRVQHFSMDQTTVAKTKISPLLLDKQKVRKKAVYIYITAGWNHIWP